MEELSATRRWRGDEMFKEHANIVNWKLHLASPPERVYSFIATDEGRTKFWSDTSEEEDGFFTLGWKSEKSKARCKILDGSPPRKFSFHYWANTTVTFELQNDGRGGTDLILVEENFPNESHRLEHVGGWVSVLLGLKAVVDHGVDLRNHDENRAWIQGYCET
jgi:uncharacterized protein YndB with AHSA1/START domain